MTNLIGNDVASMVEYAYRRGNYPKFARKFFKAGDVSGLAGAINVTYGALVYDHVNREANAHAMIKKENWERSGFRVTQSNPSTKGAGGADPGAVASVVDITPLEISAKPAFIHTPFDATMDALFQGNHDDGLNIWQWKLALYRDIHAQLLNEQLLLDAELEAAAATGNTTDAKSSDHTTAAPGGSGMGMESLDRFISSDAEEDVLGGTYSGWYDIYSPTSTAYGDRDVATTSDSYVIRPDGTTATYGTDIPFQMAGLDMAIDTTENNGAEETSQVILTKRDTRRAFYDENSSGARYDLTQIQAKLDMAGLSPSATHAGRDISFTVRAYQNRPVVVDKNVPADGKGRIYLIDQRHVHMKVGFPTLYVEVDNPVIRGQFDTKALYLTCEQPYVTRQNVHAKIRSIA